MGELFAVVRVRYVVSQSEAVYLVELLYYEGLGLVGGFVVGGFKAELLFVDALEDLDLSGAEFYV